MRTVLVIGIGAGDPDYITMQAVKALNRADVFFVMDKGAEKQDLVRLRQEICERHITQRTYRFVEAKDPERDRNPPSYGAEVEDWHQRRAALYAAMIARELGEAGCGAFLVWGDPSLYDSTLRILERILARGALAFDYEVIPGITSIQALAARHRIALNRIGEPVRITTGRRLAENQPQAGEDTVVMLDGVCAFNTVADQETRIYWGAYLGTPAEILIAGRLQDVASEIERRRAEAKAKHGWIMDTYLLRKP